MKRVFRLASILIITLMFVGCFNTVEPLKHTLIVSIQGEGFVDPTPGTYQFDKETLINISATASDDWVFSHWIGPVADTTANETTVLVEQETSVIAVFAQNSLTIQTGPGGLITRRIDGSRPASRSEKDIQYITIHAMSDALENPTNPYNMNRIRYIFDQYKVEAHYVIDRRGTVYQFVDDRFVARHAGVGRWNNDPKLTNNMNRFSIGIELLGIGADHEMLPVIGAANNLVSDIDRGFTDEQYQSIGMLVDQLMDRYQIPKHNILGHDDYDPERKWDPGVLFDWSRLE